MRRIYFHEFSKGLLQEQAHEILAPLLQGLAQIAKTFHTFPGHRFPFPC
jgi:hypothetical protein